MKRLHILLILLAAVGLAYVFKPQIKVVLSPITHQKTVAGRVSEFGAAARARLKPAFDQAQIAYPPTSVKLLAVKGERQLHIYAADKSGERRWIRTYPILAASGGPGPKLEEGDGQVPEGVYEIESLNPNSLFHVSLRVGYPNEFDRAQAAKDGRKHLGGDIMIHGNSVSIGCLAMGDEVAEDLFVLAADVGLTNLTVIITPVDFRKGKTVSPKVKLPDWTSDLYAQIKTQLADLPLKESQ